MLFQEDVVASYIAEICAVRLKLLGKYAKCDLDLSPNKLQLQLLPCNFIPIDAYPYTGESLIPGHLYIPIQVSHSSRDIYTSLHR